MATINDKANGGVVNVLTVDGMVHDFHNIQQEARKVDFSKHWLTTDTYCTPIPGRQATCSGVHRV
ncbi:hypothetical protein O9993_16660 [Vibrio lentus]|nr:hypothetical protein [Vibrio lentus]